MTDTQWPRFEVFLIEEDEKPAEHVGSVHAPDAEMALLNARDVFVRRPRCRQLWVAPSSKVLFRTAQELKDATTPPGNQLEEPQPYLVFSKPNHREPLTLSKCLSAGSAETALRSVLAGGYGADYPLWAIVSEADLTRSDPEESESFFEPAESKQYKMHADFPTGQLMKEVRQK